MTLPLRASELPMKHERIRTDQRPGLTIWEVPGHGLFRVVETAKTHFDVEALMPLGWTTLIELEDDEAATAVQALQVWLDIQERTAAPEPRREEAGSDE